MLDTATMRSLPASMKLTFALRCPHDGRHAMTYRLVARNGHEARCLCHVHAQTYFWTEGKRHGTPTNLCSRVIRMPSLISKMNFISQRLASLTWPAFKTLQGNYFHHSQWVNSYKRLVPDTKRRSIFPGPQESVCPRSGPDVPNREKRKPHGWNPLPDPRQSLLGIAVMLAAG